MPQLIERFMATLTCHFLSEMQSDSQDSLKTYDMLFPHLA
jgi:hypothetical protein